MAHCRASITDLYLHAKFHSNMKTFCLPTDVWKDGHRDQLYYEEKKQKKNWKWSLPYLILQGQLQLLSFHNVKRLWQDVLQTPQLYQFENHRKQQHCGPANENMRTSQPILWINLHAKSVEVYILYQQYKTTTEKQHYNIRVRNTYSMFHSTNKAWTETAVVHCWSIMHSTRQSVINPLLIHFVKWQVSIS